MLSKDKLLGMSDILDDFISPHDSDSSDAHRRLIRTVKRISDNELTDTQKRVITGIYIENKSMREVADELGVCLSAVSRTHKRAIERIRRYSRYASLRS